MLYIVGGTSRSGKTLITRKILAEAQIPFLSLDFLVMGFTNGVPEYGIHDKLFPHEIAHKLWPFLKAMCENMLWVGHDYVLEGEAILPQQVRELMDLHPGKVKACYVGYCDVDVKDKCADVKRYSSGTNDWLSNEPDDYIATHIKHMITHSQMLREEYQRHQLPYYDTSFDFETVLSRAKDVLLSKN